MSHIVRSAVALKNREALAAAARHLNLEVLGEGHHRLYSGQAVDGFGVSLPEWHHPVVIDAEGTAHYDNYNGHWGKQVELDRLCQRYTIEVAREQAYADGFTVQEETLENGDVSLELVAAYA